jgi:pyruvate formate lyase activating enzyme
MKTPLIFNIQRFSIHDGGGIRTIVFFKGCSLHCPWCSNPESISSERQLIRNNQRCIRCSAEDAFHCPNTPESCPVNALSCCGQEYTVEQLAREIASDQIIYDEDGGGLTLSGGEPFLYPEFLAALLSKVRPWMNSIAVETCGNVPFENIAQTLPYIDCYLYDLKIMDSEKFRQVCGGNLATVIGNLEKLVSLQKNVIPRFPLIPTFTDDAENIDKIIQLSLRLGFKQVHLLPFHQLGSGKYENLGMPYTLSELGPFSDEQIAQIANRFEVQGLQVIVGGF